MDINFFDLDITLLPSGSLYVKNENTLILSDLHLGKGVLLQESGAPLLKQIDQKTVNKLINDLTLCQPKQCIVCGDLIHGMSRRMIPQIQWFEDQLRSFNTSFIITLGNHDSQLLSNVMSLFRCVDTFQVGSVICSHYEHDTIPSISGHVHPGIKLKKGRITKYFKAFAVSKSTIICPSYGEFTGAYTKLPADYEFYLLDGQGIQKYAR